jgi:hypothetical protein
MIYYAKSTGGFYSADIHGDNIPADAVEITDEQHAALLEAQSSGKAITADTNGSPIAVDPLTLLTPTELIAALKGSVQQWLDTTAQASGYDSLASCASYISSSVAQWATDAKAAIAWRDAVWQACFTQMSAAQGTTSPVIPTATALIAALPQPAAYGWSAHAAGA